MSKVTVKLKLHHNVKDLSYEKQLVNLIVESIKQQFPNVNLSSLKHSMQLVTDVMNCVENSVNSKL